MEKYRYMPPALSVDIEMESHLMEVSMPEANIHGFEFTDNEWEDVTW